ncbi:hypothetical protein IGM_02011 [Bacillus cereus HuB4-4]|uniref:Toxin ETX/toxin MTX2 n=1 Tax=Bacillus cereus HuB4-4 TaxID=1053211 RepID=A0A9W5QWP6_BACCE|nr:ETX/MTX2 family pore-forming toxin [Bacillus cereus]EOP91365.1 hypothetical protein IGM_02011 [Bacillus cereus HuB4-4]
MKEKTKLISKKIVAKSSIIALTTSVILILPELTKADSNNILNKGSEQIQRMTVSLNRDDVRGFEDLLQSYKDPFMCTLYESVDYDIAATPNIGINFLYSQRPSYDIELDTRYPDTEDSLYVGIANLSHSGGTGEQILYSQSFSKTITETLTTSTTHGAKVGAKAGAKFKVPLVAEANGELSAEYNFANAGTSSSTQTMTYTAPSQPVKLQPGETAKVTAHLKTFQSTGKVKLRTTYKGTLAIDYKDLSGEPQQITPGMGQWIRFMHSLHNGPESFKEYLGYTLKNEDEAYQYGYGTYSVTYGTKFGVKVDIFKNTNNKNKSKFTATPIRSYSYEVTPELIKSN